MSSTITVLVVHWVKRSDDGSCCGLYVSYHLREEDYVLFAREHQQEGWRREGDIRESLVDAQLRRELFSPEAHEAHGIFHHDHARAA